MSLHSNGRPVEAQRAGSKESAVPWSRAPRARRTTCAIAAIAIAAIVAGTGCRVTGSPQDQRANLASRLSDHRAAQSVAAWRASLDTLGWRVATLDSLAHQLGTPHVVAQARAAFADARRAFKQAEVGLEYYAPTTTHALNGPALPEVDEAEGPEAVAAPTGFQVVEELLFADDPMAQQETLCEELTVLRQLVTRVKTMMAVQVTTDDRIFDAVKLEIARIVSLGITGFDSPVAGHSLSEAFAALEGIERTLRPYRAATETGRTLDSLLRHAQRALRETRAQPDFDSYAFIVQHFNPIAVAVHDHRVALGIGVPTERRGFAMQASTLFDTNAFDPRAFAPIDLVAEPAARVELGRRLFHDVRLSGDGARACSSCHIPERAFTDGLPKSRGRSGQPLPRNTPSVINIGLQVGSFSDLRTTYLEDQVTAVIENVDEMHAKLPDVVAVLRRDTVMSAHFRDAFSVSAAPHDSLITGAHIRGALAAYMRSLTRLNAPVDRALRGDSSAWTPSARRGFNVFVGKGRCATCHFLPLTNGTVPPMFQKSDVEVIGVPVRADTTGAHIDSDPGRFRISRAEPHRHAFRTPSLRNVALTAPYMHNGAYRTLESVIDFYNRGGGAGIGASLANQTLPRNGLQLSTSERQDLVTFLQALTDTTGTQRR